VLLQSRSKGSADSGALDQYQVKDGENEFAKALPVSPLDGLLLKFNSRLGLG
jgi:hypothetical protein